MENQKIEIKNVSKEEYVEPKQSANTLFKFTDRMKYLVEIIENSAIIPRYNIENINYVGIDQDQIAYPMVCFCDINITKLALHSEKYGDFGIGLKKEWVYKNRDIEPIHYINTKSNEIKDLKEAFNIAMKISDKNVEKLSNYISTSLLYTKPISGKDNEGKDYCFHDEREWRYIPKIKEEPEKGIRKILVGNEANEDYTKMVSDLIKRKKNYWLTFPLEAINYFLVKTEDENKELINCIHRMKQYELEQKLELISKILILDNLGKDW